MDDHQRGEALEQGLGPPPIGESIGGGAELAAMAFDLNSAHRWSVTVLGALLTATAGFAHAPHLPPYL